MNFQSFDYFYNLNDEILFEEATYLDIDPMDFENRKKLIECIINKNIMNYLLLKYQQDKRLYVNFNTTFDEWLKYNTFD
jgi:hypothetical protein